MSMNPDRLKQILEGALLAAGQTLTVDQLLSLFLDEEQPSRQEIRDALESLEADCRNRGVELVEVSSGFRYQVKGDVAPWVGRLWDEKPAKYSRALLETLALIAYRQPITRGEIEDVRGVSVSSQIMKTLIEREWVRVVGHRDVPGKPALYATTKSFLDYFNLKNLGELPPLAEIRSIESIERELEFDQAANEAEEAGQAQAQDETAPVQVAMADGAGPTGEQPSAEETCVSEDEIEKETEVPTS